MSIRRVVTGFDTNGVGTFVSDETLNELANSNTLLSSLWRSDDRAWQVPPKIDVEDGFGFPGPGGSWVLAWSVPGNAVAGVDGEDGATPTKAGELPSGGAHATDSIDVNVVLSGEIVFQLEDGSEKKLGRGDSIVVNGALHTWHNRGTEPAVILSLIFGAERVQA